MTEPAQPITDADLDALRRLVDSRADLCHIGLRRDTVRALIARIDREPAPIAAEFDGGDDDAPHSRACGPTVHRHGLACHPNCPTCHGQRV